MKKVLIIAFLHPFTIDGGSFRTLPLARNLPDFGWEPLILTPALREKGDSPFRVIETQYRDPIAPLKKLLGFNVTSDVRSQLNNRVSSDSQNQVLGFFLTRAGEILNYPDSHRGWKPFALEAARKIFEEETIDAMITCHPLISHIIGAELKSEYKLPWIADFPDLWSQNHNYGYSWLRNIIDKRLELKTLSDADALTTVSEPWANKLKNLHKKEQIYPINHGFNENEVNYPPVALTEKFTITYTGKVYAGKQDPTKLFAAISELLTENRIEKAEIEIRFYGSTETWLTNRVNEYGLGDIVHLYQPVSREESIKKQRESQVVLLLNWIDQNETGIFPGKIFEYLAARRPVLAVDGSDDVVSELIRTTHTGISAYSITDIKEAVVNLYGQYQERKAVGYEGEESEINRYTYHEMTRHFSDILYKVSDA